jgi:hypothetical protein
VDYDAGRFVRASSEAAPKTLLEVEARQHHWTSSQMTGDSSAVCDFILLFIEIAFADTVSRLPFADTVCRLAEPVARRPLAVTVASDQLLRRARTTVADNGSGRGKRPTVNGLG